MTRLAQQADDPVLRSMWGLGDEVPGGARHRARVTWGGGGGQLSAAANACAMAPGWLRVHWRGRSRRATTRRRATSQAVAEMPVES